MAVNKFTATFLRGEEKKRQNKQTEPSKACLARVAIEVLSNCVLEIQIFDIISSKYSEICSIFPVFFPHSIIKFVISKIL